MGTIGTTGIGIRVALVDDDRDAHLCLKDILNLAGNFNLAGCFSNAAEALTGIPRLQPDVTLMDIRLPDLNGIECTRRLKQRMPGMKIVIITGTHALSSVGSSLEAGAVAYLVKPLIVDQLLATLTFAACYQNNVGPDQKKAMPTFSPAKKAEASLCLNLREIEVLKHLAEGLLYKEISEKLGISYAAVHKCQHKIFKKLHVSNRSEAVRIWVDSRTN